MHYFKFSAWFISILGYFVIPPTSSFNGLLSLALALFGLTPILVIVFTYSGALKFDRLFKQKIINDDAVDDLYVSISPFSGRFQVRFNANRALMYMKAIFLYKSTQKSFRYPWFKGYDFRENATVFDKILAFGTPITLFVSIGLAILSFFVK